MKWISKVQKETCPGFCANAGCSSNYENYQDKKTRSAKPGKQYGVGRIPDLFPVLYVKDIDCIFKRAVFEHLRKP